MSRSSGGGAGSVVRQGLFRKLKTMKRKYFVLRAETAESSAHLAYYESEKKYRLGASPRRVIYLKSCYNIQRRLDLKHPFVIGLYMKDECFSIVMEKDEDIRVWLADLLAHQSCDSSCDEVVHPTEHVWQVNVQKKGLGATKGILGLYNLCLTDKNLTLVKIRPNSYEYFLEERLQFSLQNIRRCGDSECFFYMEVGRQTATGPGELWMHTEDANIAMSMHSTIYHAMTNLTKDNVDKDLQPTSRLRSVSATEDPRSHSFTGRRQTFSDAKNRSGISSFALSDNQMQNNKLITIDSSNKYEGKENMGRTIKHHRTFSLPTGCAQIVEPLKISHERTRSAPLTGDEVDRAIIEKVPRHSSYKAVNGCDFSKKYQWNRRDSTGAKFPKSSPGHAKNLPMRHRCESMPSRTCPPMDTDKTPSRHLSNHIDEPRDEPDAVEWHPTPGIPEEPDESYCKMLHKDLNKNRSVQHSRTSSLIDEACSPPGLYVPMSAAAGDSGYVEVHKTLSPAASSGSVCSGTPSTDPRFSEYQLDPVMSHISEYTRTSRTYSVGSKPTPAIVEARDRAYSVGARTRVGTHHYNHTSSSAPLLPRSTEDHMELDFSKTKVILSRTPPSAGFVTPRGSAARTPYKPKVDEYVDMSPKSGYVEMKPLDVGLSTPSSSMGIARSPPGRILSKSPPTKTDTDGYVEMSYANKIETPSRPITITDNRERKRFEDTPKATPVVSPQTPADDKRKKNGRSKDLTPLGSQTLFPLSLESPASDDRNEIEGTDMFEDDTHHHPLTTVREISEEGGKKSPELGSPPHYVSLALGARTSSQPIAAPTKSSESDADELSCNPMATKSLIRPLDSNSGGVSVTLVRAGIVTNLPRFTIGDDGSRKSPAPDSGLNYASLDLEPRSNPTTPAPPRTYTQIDFARSEKLNTADAN